ncbi:MAG: hypothetical protein KAX38_09620 [Candidatus Krumholzibacteria bacterium]|nr:hypothetical protein [Candidatus Krumholzibacteria bacterium]
MPLGTIRNRFFWPFISIVFVTSIFSCSDKSTISEPQESTQEDQTLSWELLATRRVFTGVWGSGESDVFAVGLGGTILHYDGSNWSLMNSPTTKDLYDVWGSSENDVFAMGLNGTILHSKP